MQASRNDLFRLVDTYLEALVRHEPGGLPLAPDFRATENGQPLNLGDGLWASARGIQFRRTYVDASSQQACFFGVVIEGDDSPVIFVLRIKARRGEIAEAETLVARQGCHPLFFPNDITDRAVMTSIVPEAERAPREEMIEIADRYFDAIEQSDASIVALHPDCNRRENGFLTTNNPPRLPFSTASGIPRLSYIKQVSERRYPVVDEARGIVFGIVRFDIPGDEGSTAGSQLEQSLRSRPRSLFLYELFKIEDGLIRDIEAFMSNAPLRAPMGWEQGS